MFWTHKQINLGEIINPFTKLSSALGVDNRKWIATGSAPQTSRLNRRRGSSPRLNNYSLVTSTGSSWQIWRIGGEEVKWTSLNYSRRTNELTAWRWPVSQRRGDYRVHCRSHNELGMQDDDDEDGDSGAWWTGAGSDGEPCIESICFYYSVFGLQHPHPFLPPWHSNFGIRKTLIGLWINAFDVTSRMHASSESSYAS